MRRLINSSELMKVRYITKKTSRVRRTKREWKKKNQCRLKVEKDSMLEIIHLNIPYCLHYILLKILKVYISTSDSHERWERPRDVA